MDGKSTRTDEKSTRTRQKSIRTNQKSTRRRRKSTQRGWGGLFTGSRRLSTDSRGLWRDSGGLSQGPGRARRARPTTWPPARRPVGRKSSAGSGKNRTIRGRGQTMAERKTQQTGSRKAQDRQGLSVPEAAFRCEGAGPGRVDRAVGARDEAPVSGRVFVETTSRYHRHRRDHERQVVSNADRIAGVRGLRRRPGGGGSGEVPVTAGRLYLPP